MFGRSLPAGSNLDAWVSLWTETGGSEVRGDDNAGPNSDAYISNELATYTGKYYVQVGKSYWATTPGNYLVYVDVVRGAQAESDGGYGNNAVGWGQCAIADDGGQGASGDGGGSPDGQ